MGATNYYSKAFMSTVQHTGSQYFLKQLESKLGVIKFQHCNKSTYDIAKTRDVVFTTYRDPHRTAASWYNRDLFQTPKGRKLWELQWPSYWKLRALNPIVFDFTKGQEQHGYKFAAGPDNSHADKYGLHKALDQNDLKYFHRYIPKELIDHAKKENAQEAPQKTR